MVLDELEHPIVQAPLAGGPGTVELTAEVSKAGGLGFIGGAYQTADSLRGEIRELREATSASFGVNLFVPQGGEIDRKALEGYAERLRPEAERYGAHVGEPRADDDDEWNAKLAVLHEEFPPIVSFTFGCPPAATVDSLRELGSEVWITVTTPEEARTAAEGGAEALVCQGTEAGGHQASFEDTEGQVGFGVLALLRLVAAEVDLPLVAAGGIADGPGVAAVLAGGARAAQVGTAFLLATEARTPPIYRAALMSDRPTALTRAFSGRTARGIANRFMAEHTKAAPAAFPYVHHLTTPIRAAAREKGDVEGFNLWAGQAHSLARELPAAEVVRSLAEGARAALEEAASRTSRTDSAGTKWR